MTKGVFNTHNIAINDTEIEQQQNTFDIVKYMQKYEPKRG